MIVLMKAVLLASLAMLAYLALFQIRWRWFQRAPGIALSLVLATFIAFPDVANWASHLVGIGRGADLVLYVVHVLVGYFGIRLYQRQLRHDEQLTELVRALALQHARDPRIAAPQPNGAAGPALFAFPDLESDGQRHAA